jgi:hypothetical protein
MEEVDSFADLDLSEEDVESVTPAGVTPRSGLRSASPGTSPLFSSPSSTMSGLTGGVGGGGGLVTPIYCVKAADWCGGAINGSSRGATGGRFCCKVKKECKTQSHKHQKVVLNDGTLYLQGPRAGQARVEPALKIDEMPMDVKLDELLMMHKPYDVMIAYFSSIASDLETEQKKPSEADKSASASSPGSWVPLDLDQVVLMEEASRMMKSPSKLKMGPFLATMADSTPMGGPKLEPTQEIPLGPTGKGTPDDQTLFLILNGWNNLVKNVALLRDGMDGQSAGERMFRDSLGTTISDLQGAIDLTDGKIKIMTARVGDLPATATDPTTTVWEAIESVQTDLDDAKVLLAGQKTATSEQADKLTKTDNRLHILSQSYGNLAESYKRQITRLNQSVTHLTRAAAPGLRTRTDGLSRGEPGRFDFNGSTVDDALIILQELQEKVEHLTGATNQHVGQDAFRRIVEDVRKLEDQVQSGGSNENPMVPPFFQTQIDELTEKLNSFDHTSSDGAVILPNHTFASYRDVRKFIEEEQVISVGGFLDLFSALVVMTPKQQSGQERANEQHASSRINTTTFENDLAAAMSHEKPKTLYGNAKLKDGFGHTIKSYEDWSDTSDCVKDTLTKHLEDYVKGVEGNLVGSKHGNRLAKDLLVKVVFQWNKFCAHIDRFYKELTTVSNFSPKSAHLLIGRSSNAVWSAMRPFRTRIALLDNLKSLDNKASFIWGVLQCHRIMDEFIKFNFQSHPAFVKEMSLFVLTERVDPSQIVTVNHTVASLKTIVSDMTKKTTHLEAKYDKMKRNYDNLVNDVAMLKKQTPGGTSRSSKRRRGKAGANEESAAEEDESE